MQKNAIDDLAIRFQTIKGISQNSWTTAIAYFEYFSSTFPCSIYENAEKRGEMAYRGPFRKWRPLKDFDSGPEMFKGNPLNICRRNF